MPTPRVRAFCLILTALLGAGVSWAQTRELDHFPVDSDDYLAHVRVLAADELGGRGNGTAGLDRAADYIASRFRKAGLQPAGDAGTFLQRLDISAQFDDGASTLLLKTRGGLAPFRVGVHYYPLSVPGSALPLPGATAPASAGLVFAGYGIAAPGLGYDDYAGLNVMGKAVIVFTHEPQENDARSSFEGRALTPHSDIAVKADVAARRGARLLMVIEDPAHLADRALTTAWTNDPQIGEYGIPVLRVDRARLGRLVPELDLERRARDIDATLTPRSGTLANIELSFTEPLLALHPHVNNVVGVLTGSDPTLAGEAIVVGAHYDHLGLGGRFSRETATTGEIHNGADDNASGTAAVIEMARAAAVERRRFDRSIVFVAFAGEELGLLGSRYYVKHPPAGIRKTVAMLNLDMVGRANGRVLIGGAEKRPRFRRIIAELRPQSALRLDGFREGYGDGASDNDSFERDNVPALMFFTGFHDDYHKPSDDWDRIDAPGAAEIARLALAITARLAR